MKQHKLPLITAVIIALIAGFWAGDVFIDKQPPEQASPSHVMLLDVPQKLAIPALQQENNAQFDNDSLSGKWSILFFGYTNCPDVCPATLNTLAQAKKAYRGQHQQGTETDFPQVVFISVDPERDDADLLAQYVQYFDRDFIGVTAEEKLLRAITVQTYSNYIAEPAQENGRYLVNHTVNLVLVNPNAEMVAVLSPPHSVSSILEALSKFEL